MYDRHLESFITAADCGSFSKAAEKMFISPNAITKHINLLEQRLQIKLFCRSPKGLTLTETGKLIYKESSDLLHHCEQVMEQAKQIEARQKLEEQPAITIRLGISILNPGSVFLNQWQEIADKFPNIKIKVLPYEDTLVSFSNIIKHFGTKIDAIACPCVNDFWRNTYNMLITTEVPCCVACSVNHPLAAYDEVSLENLRGYSVIFSHSSPTNLRIKTSLSDIPEIKIKTIDAYNIDIFEQTIFSKDLLLIPACYSHPLLKNIPLKEKFSFPYGIIYPKHPSDDISAFIQTLQTALKQNDTSADKNSPSVSIP